MTRRTLTLAFLLASLVAASFFSAELFGDLAGTDDLAQELADRSGAAPIAEPFFEPPADAERWLFALQGLGGIALLALVLRTRRGNPQRKGRA
jgi:ABC-type cobalt transport system substrate-binding protein